MSLRTIANWQRRRVVPFLKAGRVVRFRRDQVEAALADLTLAPVSVRVNRRATVQGEPQ